MANVAGKTLSFGTIDQVSGGLVATKLVAYHDENTVAPVRGQFFSRQIVEAKALTPGSHATFHLCVEGSNDGTSWFSVMGTLMSDAMASLNATATADGFSVPVLAAQQGVCIVLNARFDRYRIGVGGDNGASDGTAVARMVLTKDE